MPTHHLKITTPMVCGGCTGTVEKALLAVPGVTAATVSLADHTATVTSEGCPCTVGSGTCTCTNCTCLNVKLIAAAHAVGFAAVSTTSKECATAKLGPCGKANCTCGDDCQCGKDCRCAGCGDTVSCGKPGCTCGPNCQCGSNCKCSNCGVKSCCSGSAGPCGKLFCTCGPNCQCGSDCQCSSCNVLTMKHIGVGVALFALGFITSQKMPRK